jgi:hypothetical protein
VATRFYRATYIHETNSFNDVVYRTASAIVPVWSSALNINEFDAAGENSPGRIASVRGDIIDRLGNGRIFYVGWSGFSVYVDGFEFTGVGHGQALPATFRLDQNYPNPFNPVTEIRYTIAERAPVNLRIYNVLGEEVAVLVNSEQSPGMHAVRFDGATLASGVYFCRLQAGDFTDVRKMLLLK